VIKQKQDEINAVKSEGAAQSEAVKRLEKEKAVIEENTKKLQEKVGALEATERPAVFTFDPKILEEIRISSKTLQKSLPDSMPEIKIDDLSKSLQKNLTKFDWKKFDLSKVLSTEIED